MNRIRAALLGLFLVAVVVITIAGLRERPPPPVQVQMTSVKRATITRTVTGAGKLQAATTVKISSNLSGDLVELAVKVGDRVTKGQILGRIDRRRFEASARQSMAAQSAARAEVQVVQVEVQRASAEFERVVALVAKGMASNAELERARADRDTATARLSSSKERLAQAQAAFDEAQTALSNTILVSPIDGSVIEVSREVGERVRGSDFSEDVVMTLASLAAMEVRIEVGEHEVVHLEAGQRAEVLVDALEGESFEGEVMEIAQKAVVKAAGTEAEVTSFPIIVALKTRPPRVLSGMSAEVRIAAQTRQNALVVPVQAVTVRPSKMLSPEKASKETYTKVVFVVGTDSRVSIQPVKTGISSDADIEIQQGLQEGSRVVEGPYRTLAKELREGDFVEELSMGPSKRQRSGKRSARNAD